MQSKPYEFLLFEMQAITINILQAITVLNTKIPYETI